MKELPIRRGLRPYLPENQQELLDLVVVARQHKTDDDHEQTGKPLATQHQLDDLLQRRRLRAVVAML